MSSITVRGEENDDDIGDEDKINNSIHDEPGINILEFIDIECDDINISSEGNLKGNIKAIESFIDGSFEGDVFAESLGIGASANIKGNLYYNNLKAQPGAKLDVQLIIGLEKDKKAKGSNKESLTKSIKSIKG